MVTLKEIAKECGVSATTVSNILNGKPKVSEETRQKILKVVAERGYSPNYIAQGLRKQKTKTIGIIAEDIKQFTTPAMIESIMEYCEEKGYCTILENLRLYARWGDAWYNNQELFRMALDPSLQKLKSIKVDGLIYVAGHARVIDCFPQDFDLPMVMSYAYTHSRKIPAVVIEDEKGSYDMVQYLLSMGHRKIGILAGRADNIHTQKRLLGVQKALFEAGVPFNPAWVRYAGWVQESGYAEASYFMDSDVTVVFCFSDLMARGVYDYMGEHGFVVGKDLSIAGFDNHEAAIYSYPPLTTMEIPLYEIGHQAAKMLLQELEDEETKQNEKPIEIAVPCKLLVRNSVATIE